MQVKNVYQDSDGKWHIDYDSGHLIGLAIRVWLGEFLLGIYIALPLIFLATVVGVLASIVSSEPLHQSEKITPNYNFVIPQKSVCTESN